MTNHVGHESSLEIPNPVFDSIDSIASSLGLGIFARTIECAGRVREHPDMGVVGYKILVHKMTLIVCEF